MFHKIKILTLMQLSEKFKLKTDLSFQQKLGQVGKMLIKMGISFGLFTVLFLVIFKVLFIPPTVNLFTFVIFIMQIFGIIAQTSKLSDSLYMSKDNAILLTYPVKHELVYFSKIVVAYVIELYRSILFIFPIFMAFMTIVSRTMYGMNVLTLNYVILSVLFSIVLPLFPVLIGAILSIPVTYIRKGIKKYTSLKLLGLLILIGGLTTITYLIVNYLPSVVLIVQRITQITEKADEIFVIANKFSLHCLFIGRAMGSINTWLNVLFTFLILFGLIAISILVSMPLFFNLASSSSENAVIKKHKGINKAYKNPFMTFMHKELVLSIRNIGDFASDYLFLFLMPFVLSIMAAIFMRVDRNNLGLAMTYSFIGFITLILLSASSTAAATAISSEGNEFVLLKTAPSNTSKIIWSKLLMNFIMNFIMLSLSYGILTLIFKDDNNLKTLWIVYLVVLLVSFGVMMWSIQLDIEKPKLKEYANSEKRSDVSNFGASIGIGLGVGVVFSAIMIIVFLIGLPLLYQGLILLAIALGFCLVRLYFLIGFTKAYFQDIEL